jgi:hypothetical protein
VEEAICEARVMRARAGYGFVSVGPSLVTARNVWPLAYVEEDGLLLSVGFLAAAILIGLGSAAVWGTIIGATLISVW